MKYVSTLLVLFLLVSFFPSHVQAEFPDYEAIYAPVLNSTLDLILNGTENHPLQDGEMGIAEVISGQKPSFSLERIGYALQDINRDSIPELILGSIDGCELYAIYTNQKEEPKLLVEGWARNTLALLCDGNLLNVGSNGAMYSFFRTYTLTPDNLECIDFFFTYEKEDAPEETGIYHNCTGIWDREEAEEMEMPIEAFWRLYGDLQDKIVPLAMTPITTYGMQKGAVSSLIRGRWLADLPIQPANYTEYCTADASAEIVLSPVGSVSNIRLLSLMFRGFDESGNPSFDSTVVYSQDTLSEDCPLIIRVCLGEILPTYGISYVDDHGITHTCTLEQSGKDGSLLMKE